MNLHIALIQKMIQSRREQLESCNRMMELLHPEFEIFDNNRGRHNLYVVRDYVDHKNAAKRHSEEIEALEALLSNTRAQLPAQWEVVKNENRVSLQSSDFTHDVRLYVNGDFRCKDNEIAFATGVARKLNIDMDELLTVNQNLHEANAALEEALRRYGDKIAMANAPAHLQEHIDNAMARGWREDI